MSFPDASGTIPPACFYNMQGLAGFLNQNPTFKSTFINYIPNGPLISSILSTIGTNVENIPVAPDVKWMSYNQYKKYDNQLQLFHKVYAWNSNAYVQSDATGLAPRYYNFVNYQEFQDYKAGVSFVNKLYPFEIIVQYWSIPFPLYA